jgi:hypothetical protein
MTTNPTIAPALWHEPFFLDVLNVVLLFLSIFAGPRD